jgi:hypothetical protein
VPRFSDFYARVVALKAKYPNIQLSTYSDSNLQTLKEIATYCDSTGSYHYSSTELTVLRSAEYHRGRPQGSPHSILNGVAVKLRHDAYQRACIEMQGEIFPGLKQHIMGKAGFSEKEEKKAMDVVAQAESQWRRHKHFARMPSSRLDEIGTRLVLLNSYYDVIKKDRQFALPEELKDALYDLSDQFYQIMKKTRSQLIDAMLARLALIPAIYRRFMSVPTERVQPAAYDESYDDNVVVATLVALVEAGLDRKYVETFKGNTETQSTLTLDMVKKFRDCITVNGNASQQNLLASLFDAPFEAQTEFPMSTTLPIGALPKVIELRIGEKGKYAYLDGISKRFMDCRQILSQRRVTPNVKQFFDLYDEAEIPSLDPFPNPLINHFTFTYHTPSILPALVVVKSQQLVPATVEIKRATPKAISDCLDFTTKYAIGRHADGHHHTRQGRAEHLATMLAKMSKQMQEVSDAAKFQQHCHYAIVILFLHYQSINDVTSDLSKQLETCLIDLLGVSAMSEEVKKSWSSAFVLREEKQSELVSRLAKGCRFAMRLFHSDLTEIKEKDPVFGFLQQVIIMHCPDVCELLYEKIVKSGQTQCVPKSEMLTVLSKLKQKDREETKFFMQEGIAKEDFDGVFVEVARKADIAEIPTVPSSVLPTPSPTRGEGWRK